MENALNLIKRHEGLRLEAYRCPAGVLTIGYGHTSGVTPGMRITAAEAERHLRADIAALRSRLHKMADEAGVTLTANREAALLSFAFNVGFDALSRSTLWRKVCANPSDPAIAAELSRWKYAAGRVMPGLVARRAEEAALYFKQ